MSHHTDHPVSLRATLIGLAFGAAISIIFAATGNPGLIGVGAAIGASLAVALNERRLD